MYNVYPLWKFITCAETAGTINPIRKPAKIARIIPKNEKLKAFEILLTTGESAVVNIQLAITVLKLLFSNCV